MMNVSSIKLHMYCPMKLYIKTHVDTNENEDYQLAVEIKKLKIDINDLIQKNMRKVKKDMTLSEIENVLSQNIDPHIESTTKSIKSMNLGLENSQINEMIDDAYFKIKITALKTKQAMTILNKNAFAITDMFFPNSMYSYMLKDKSLDLIGICDKMKDLRDKTKVTIASMSKAVWPMIISCVVALLLITYVPWFSLFILGR